MIGALAGLLAFVLGYISRPHRETWFESALMIVSAMLCASLSSVVLSAFMSSLVLVSRRFKVNPGSKTLHQQLKCRQHCHTSGLVIRRSNYVDNSHLLVIP